MILLVTGAECLQNVEASNVLYNPTMFIVDFIMFEVVWKAFPSNCINCKYISESSSVLI